MLSQICCNNQSKLSWENDDYYTHLEMASSGTLLMISVLPLNCFCIHMQVRIGNFLGNCSRLNIRKHVLSEGEEKHCDCVREMRSIALPAARPQDLFLLAIKRQAAILVIAIV